MCRLAGFVGDSQPLSWLLYDAPHSLEEQSYLPGQMLSGAVNVDGSGIAWWEHELPEPLRYVTDRTLWADVNLPLLSRRIQSRVQIAAVRSATPGLAHGPSAVAPFVYDRWAFAHNGRINGFRGAVGKQLFADLPDDLLGEYDVVNDSLLLFLTVVGIIRSGSSMAEAIEEVVGRTIRVCRQHGTSATLNLLISDGDQIVATRASHGEPPNSLWFRDGLVASEPVDDEAWEEVPEASLALIDGHGITVGSLA